MKTIVNPAELEWHTTPLPSATVCHPDSRILLYNCVSENQVDLCTLRPHSIIPDYWIDEKQRSYAPSRYQFTGMNWAWYRRF